MRFIGYNHNGDRYIGAVDGTQVTPLGTVDAFYHDPHMAMTQSSPNGATLDLEEVEEAPPVPLTSRIFCVGINYMSHADESKQAAGLDVPKNPMVFGRWESTLVPSGAGVPVPPNEEGLDWEVELAAIIGEKTWQATEDTALQHVLGYTVFNDLSARNKQLATPQFSLGKNADRSGPIGPSVVTTDELPDPTGLRVQTRVNGEIMQDANTDDLIHSVGRIIEWISDTVTLMPGDVIATGTPGGVGLGMTPPTYLQPGDVVEVEIEKIGVVRTPITTREALGL